MAGFLRATAVFHGGRPVVPSRVHHASLEALLQAQKLTSSHMLAVSVLWSSVEFCDRLHGSSKQLSEFHQSWQRSVHPKDVRTQRRISRHGQRKWRSTSTSTWRSSHSSLIRACAKCGDVARAQCWFEHTQGTGVRADVMLSHEFPRIALNSC